ncbi:MAG: hypothetical protein WC292_05495 [Clostridia bacterium]
MNEKRERKISIIKGATAIVLIVTLASALVFATIMVANQGGADVGGKITAQSLDEYVIRYSPETETAFLTAAREYFTKMFSVFLNEGEVFQAYWLSRPLLLALQRAEISADKVLAFADYLRNADPSGVIVMDDSDPENIRISVLPNGVDFLQIISDIVAHTGITPDELGTFIYEHLLDAADPVRQELLRELGRENFITIFIDTTEIYSQIQMFLDKQNPSLSEGRMAREVLYELGSRYRAILSDFGYEKIEQLFGIGGDIISASDLPEGINSLPMLANINAVSRAMQGMTGYYFGVMSGLLMSFDSISAGTLSVTDALVNYINDGDDTYFVYGILKIINAAKDAHIAAMQEYGITEEKVFESVSVIAARLKVSGDEDNSKYAVYLAEEQEFVQTLFATMYDLSAESKSIDEIRALPQAEIVRLKGEIEIFAEGMDKFKAGLDKVQSFILIAMVFGLLPNDAVIR